jgi:hypothetical protein
MKRQPLDTVDLSTESTLTIQPDGRIYAFGITRPLLEVLAALPMADDGARRLLAILSGPCARTGPGPGVPSVEEQEAP